MEHDDKEAFKQMYKSSLRASYFQTMKNNFPQKSKISLNNIEGQSEKVDENTFRLHRNFVSNWGKNFEVFRKTSIIYIQPQGFFSCILTRKKYQLTLINTKLRVSSGQTTIFFLDFNLVSAQALDRGTYFEIAIRQSPKVLYFEPVEQKNNSVQQWTDFLNKTIVKDSQGKKNSYVYLPKHYEQFYKTQCISNQQFQKSANSGDILLFRSQHSAARLQQFFTNSQYDHVGIVLRNGKNQLFVYQSTSTQGVGLTSWKQMIKYQWYSQTQKIAWKRLRINLDQKLISIIQAYVAKTLGKGFQLNLDKIFKFQSTLKRTSEQQQKKTYFCSQLAARLYKQMGLIDQTKASTQYYPVDFSDKGSIKFLNENIILENERIISFDGVNK